MQSKLIENLKTKEEAEILSDEINFLLQSLFRRGDGGFENSLKKDVRSWVSEIIRVEIEGRDTKEYFEEILKDLGKIKSVAITLAYQPTEISVRRFYEVLQSAMPKKIVLELLYDPQIVGGMVVSYGGRYKDYSFRKIFEDELESTRSQVIEMINKVKK